MGWDDSDSDSDFDVGALLKENEKQRRRDEGLPSESEESEEEVVDNTAPEKEKVEVYVPLADPEAEKARQKKMQEETELNAVGDLFGSAFIVEDKKKEEEEAAAAAKKAEDESLAAEVAQKKKQEVKIRDFFQELEIANGQKFEEIITQAFDKVKTCTMKGGQARFVNELLKILLPLMTTADLAALEKKVQDKIKSKKLASTEKSTKEMKATAGATKNTKFNVKDELNCVYGGGWGEGDWDDGDWDDDDWDENDWGG